MKLMLDVQPDGQIEIQSDSDQIDVTLAMFMLELARVKLLAMWAEAVKNGTLEIVAQEEPSE